MTNPAVRCVKCGFEASSPISSFCPRCGSPLVYQYENRVFKIDSSRPGVWRYSSLLPELPEKISKGEGLTPFSRIGGVLVKNERQNPTGTYGDRASALIASWIKASGAKSASLEYVVDFTRSLVYYLDGVVEDLRVIGDIYRIEPEDLFYFAKKGVELSLLTGSLNDPYVSYINPLTVEGLKTIVFELYEKKVDAKYVVVPAQTGLLAFSLAKGIADLKEAGIDPGYRVVAAKFKEQPYPSLLKHVREVEIEEVAGEEVYKSYVELLNKGVYTKILSCLSYIVARRLGNAVAIVTVGYRPSTRSRKGEVAELVLEVLRKNKRKMSAYEIWRNSPVYTLRAIYKAVRSLESEGALCGEVVMKGRKKVKLFEICQ